MSKITTAGELRQFLCSAINMVGNGTLDTAKARDITKLAAQVTENLYAEAKVSKLQIELGAEVAKFGNLKLGSGEEE